MGNRDTQAALRYHEATAHSEWSLRTNRHFLDWDNQPIPFKIYRDLEPIPLPRDFPAHSVPALEALAPVRDAAASDEDERTPNLAVLARVLYLSAGITKVKRHTGGEIAFRAYSNTGALYHIDLYLVTGDLPDLPAGVYHFGPHDFALRRLREGDYRGVLVEASGENPDVARAPLSLVSASTYWRNAWKYQARAYRHCFWDAGTLHANLLAAAGTQHWHPRIVMGYADRSVEALLALDPEREGALTLVPLGRLGCPVPTPPTLPALSLATEPPSHSEVDYPEIGAMHAASSLADGGEAAAWRSVSSTQKPSIAVGPLRALPTPDEAQLPDEALDEVVRRRGSTRVFDAQRPITLEQLSALLERSTRGVPADFLDPLGVTLLDLYLIVHGVEGLAPGAYHYCREEHSLELLREGQFRQAAGRLGLGQALPAQAAVDVYSLTDLPRVLDRFGNRGYRAAQLEGGITGGRMYLAAYAQRFGATGLTFFDAEVTEFFSPHAAGKSAMFLVALGHPDRAALGLQT